MGQTEGSSCMQPQQGIFLQEMRVYQWRADTKVNIFLPRVYFKSALVQLQQQKFSQFLQQQSRKQYFQISKVKQQLEHVARTGDDQVIVFQKYQCSLAQLHGKLTLQQALYALQALLAGYEQIKKVYQSIIVDANCCFLTLQGSIRAWINPNVKSNRIWKEHQAESPISSIAQRIIRMVEQHTRIEKRSLDFFGILLNNIANRQVSNWSFGEIRRWINQYCYHNNIQMARKINLGDKKMDICGERESNIWQRKPRKTQTTQKPDYCKQNNAMFHSTQTTRFHQPFLKVRSLQKNTQIMPGVFEVRNMNLASSPIRQSNSDFRLQQSPSRGYATIKIQPQPPNSAFYPQTVPQSNLALQNPSFVKRVQRCSQNIKQAQPSPSKIKQAYNKQQPKSIKSAKIAEKEAEYVVKKPSIKNMIAKNQKFTDQAQKKKSLQVSILKNVVQTNQVRKEARYRTFAEKQFLEGQSATESVCYSRPWITTQTITRLISDNEQKYSLKNSIAQSSDRYNGSIYSGVLTQMGRDIQNPTNGGNKTLGVSQQF